MAQVALDINGRRYEVACDDGQEDRLRRVGHFVDQRVRALARAVGPVSETRLLLMASLMLADEMLDVAEGQPPPDGLGQTGPGRTAASEPAAEDAAAAALENLAKRLERIAGRLEPS